MSDNPRDRGATEELDSLLGAYALDAIDADDRARVDAYLERDAAARAEVDGMRETAAALAMMPVTAMDAPPELWERIAGAIAAEAVEPTEPKVDELEARRARRVRAQWTAAAAAAAVIALVVLAAQVASLRGQLDRAHRLGPSAMAAAFDRATKVDGARQVGLKTGSGATLARLVLLPDGTGYLRGDHLEPLPADKTYQLWAVTGDAHAPVSAGLLGSDPRAVTFRASGPVKAFAVTIERAGGVVQPTQTPIAQAALT
jgi:anti-sigma-K factor RskA